MELALDKVIQLEYIDYMSVERRMTHQENLKAQEVLLHTIWCKLPELKKLMDDIDTSPHCATEELFYRYYHQSFKTYAYQSTTLKIVKVLKTHSPQTLNDKFLELIAKGTGKRFR